MLRKKSTRLLLGKFFGNTKALLFLIVLFGLILRLVFFSGMGTSDDLAYSRYAASIDGGIEPESTLTLSTRLGIVYTTAFSYKLFGINDFSSVIFVLLTSLASIILIFYFGKLLFGEKAGLMAAFLLSFFPLDVFYSTKLMTDLPSAFFMALAIYLFLKSEKINNKVKSNVYCLLSGISLGMAYLIKELSVLIALFFVIYMAYNRKIKSQYWLIILGFVVISFIEALYLLKMTGDFFYRFN